MDIRVCSCAAQDLLMCCSGSAHVLLRICSCAAQDLLMCCSGSAHVLLRVCSCAAQDLLKVFSKAAHYLLKAIKRLKQKDKSFHDATFFRFDVDTVLAPAGRLR